MTAGAILLALEDMDRPVALVPRERGMNHGYPLTPTEVLARYRRLGARYLNIDTAMQPDMVGVWLPPWGWVDVLDARVVDATDEMGGPLLCGKSVAVAIARTDDLVKAVPLGLEWVLAHAYRVEMVPTFVTCAFWLRTRHNCFLAAVADHVAGEESARQEPPIPIYVLHELAAPDPTLIQ